MSFQDKPIAIRHVEPFCIPVHVSPGAYQSVLLFPLGGINAPVTISDLSNLGEFIYQNRGVAKVGFEGAGFSREDFFRHEETPNDLLVQFANWVRDNGATSDEVRAGIDLAIGFIVATRTTTKEAA